MASFCRWASGAEAVGLSQGLSLIAPPTEEAPLCLVAPADLAVKQPFKSACLLTALSCLRGGSSFYQESWSNSLQIKAPPAPFPLQVSFSLSKSLKEKPSLNSPQECLKGTTSQCKHTQKNDTYPRPKSLSPHLLLHPHAERLCLSSRPCAA